MTRTLPEQHNAKILIVSAVFPPEPVVSANLSSDVAKALIVRNSPFVVSPPPSRPYGFNFDNKYSHDYFEFKHIQLKSYTCPQSRLIGRLMESYSFGKHSSRLIKQRAQDIDLIYANTWPLLAQFLTVKTSKRFRIPIIIHVQDVYPESLTSKLPIISQLLNICLLPIDKYILRNASIVIAISDKMKNYLVKTRKLDGQKVFVIPNWQDEEEFISFRQSKQKNVSNNTFTFMYLGNIGPVAGIDLLIDGFVKNNMPNCRLIIAGSGSQKEYLQKKCIQDKLVHIEFWDVPKGKVPEIQDQADVMLLPIKKGAASSSIPSKMPAYMFSAKPIIATVDCDSDTANAIREAGCGWVIEPENPTALASMMQKVSMMAGEELLAMGLRGREYALQHFSKQANLSKLVSVIEGVLEK